MQYMMLIYVNEVQDAARSKEEQEAVFAEYTGFDEQVKAKGIALSAAALHPTTAATSVRVRDGKVLTMDGPFAETKEQLGGYYLLECEDLDEAIEWASKIPDARIGTIEIRPKFTFG